MSKLYLLILLVSIRIYGNDLKLPFVYLSEDYKSNSQLYSLDSSFFISQILLNRYKYKFTRDSFSSDYSHDRHLAQIFYSHKDKENNNSFGVNIYRFYKRSSYSNSALYRENIENNGTIYEAFYQSLLGDSLSYSISLSLGLDESKNQFTLQNSSPGKRLDYYSSQVFKYGITYFSDEFEGVLQIIDKTYYNGPGVDPATYRLLGRYQLNEKWTASGSVLFTDYSGIDVKTLKNFLKYMLGTTYKSNFGNLFSSIIYHDQFAKKDLFNFSSSYLKLQVGLEKPLSDQYTVGISYENYARNSKKESSKVIGSGSSLRYLFSAYL